MGSVILPAAEVARFWAAGVPLEAVYVPDDELQRALAEGRVQTADSSSSMGTAETWWRRASGPVDNYTRENGVVVPPGKQADDWDDSYDDRDVMGLLWDPFWSDQATALARAIPEARQGAMLEECARMLVELEAGWPHDFKHRGTLLDWLASADRIDVAAELEAHTTTANRHLARGVRARWITRDIALGFDAVMKSALRFDDSWQRTRQRPVRLALLRYGVALT